MNAARELRGVLHDVFFCFIGPEQSHLRERDSHLPDRPADRPAAAAGRKREGVGQG